MGVAISQKAKNMPALDKYASYEIENLCKTNLLRVIQDSEKQEGIYIKRNGKKIISFSCNDYFDLSQHPKTIEASIKAIQRYGVGAGASRLITGNNPLYNELEKALAEYKKTEAACVFGSGYLANVGTISALVAKGDLIVADRLAHACMIDGAKLSGATLKRFKHNDIDSLSAILSRERSKFKKCLIITETIFSMDGDFSPVKQIVARAKKYDCWTLTDDAHGFGITQPNNQVDIQLGTLSKGVGSYGGYICAKKEVIDYIKNKARTLIYSTALPPATLAASVAAIKIIQSENERTLRPIELSNLFADLVNLPRTNSPIFSLVLGSEASALDLSEKLLDEGFLVSAIRPPTVQKNTSRLRISFSYLHKPDYIRRLAKTINNMEKNS